MSTMPAPTVNPDAAAFDAERLLSWSPWLSRRQVIIMAVAAALEFAITLGVMGLAARSSADLERARQDTGPSVPRTSLAPGEGLRVPVPAWAAPGRAPAS
jgi:hypothetical protein